MVVFKVIFWAMVVAAFSKMVDCLKDHPRIESPRNLGFDVVSLILNIGLAVWIGISIFN